MDTIAQKLWVQDIGQMVSFYKEYLGAEVLDQHETFACLAVEDTVVEFYHGSPGTMHLTLQFNDFDTLSERATLARNHIVSQIKSRSTGNQTTYSTVLKDCEGNRITLIFHQMYVSEYVDVE